MTGLRIGSYGDSALLVRAVRGDKECRWRTVQRLADRLADLPYVGVRDLVATYDCLLVEFDCTRTDHAAVTRAVHDAAAAPDGQDGPDGKVGAEPSGRLFHVPVVYGGDHGPDLPNVADQLGLTVGEVVRLHSSTEWVVRFLGAPAGAPMLDGSALPAEVRRCPRPRPLVTGGSVALAGAQCVIYPVPSPGGWRLIGHTPLRFVDPSRWPHVAYRPGDRIRFERISAVAGRALE